MLLLLLLSCLTTAHVTNASAEVEVEEEEAAQSNKFFFLVLRNMPGHFLARGVAVILCLSFLLFNLLRCHFPFGFFFTSANIYTFFDSHFSPLQSRKKKKVRGVHSSFNLFDYQQLLLSRWPLLHAHM